MNKPDYILIICVFALVVFGLVMLSSASSVLSYEQFGHNYYYLKHQLFYGVASGLVLLIVFSKIDYHKLRKFASFLLLATLVLLVLVFIPGLGFEYGGATRWISLGPITMQPTEIAKLTFLIYLATWLEKRERGVKDFSVGLLPFMTILGIISLLTILQPDIGTLTIIVLSAICVYFVAGAPLRHLAFLGAVSLGLFWLLVKIAPYRMARLTVFLNPEIDPQGIGYQINQALLAIGSGGLFGLGLGHSIQKHNYLPEVTGDSIFAVIAEELGFIRVLILVSLFLIFALRGFSIAKKAPDLYGRLLACGITSWIAFQAFINIAAMVAILPLTGIPLPFVSYGGTALISALAGVGILINISKQIKPAKTAA